MVTFRCVNKVNNKTTYKYFPEADERKKSGLITFDFANESYEITRLAELDWIREISADELNTLADSINEMKREIGEMDYIEHVSESEQEVVYADKVISRIWECYLNGNIPESGTVVWY